MIDLTAVSRFDLPDLSEHAAIPAAAMIAPDFIVIRCAIDSELGYLKPRPTDRGGRFAVRQAISALLRDSRELMQQI